MTRAYIIAARRTPVVPRHGTFAKLSVPELAVPCITALLHDASLSVDQIDDVVMGNALYGGGNPARLCALLAGLYQTTPAFTLDTQCCSGLDAIMLAAHKIRAGDAHIVIAGGVESYSRSPLRFQRPKVPFGQPSEYFRPPFTPWHDRDPDMIEAAALLAHSRNISRQEQEAYAVQSHEKACAATFKNTEIVSIEALSRDAFARRLNPALCARLPVIAGDKNTALTPSTIAVEADASACVLIVSETVLKTLNWSGFCTQITQGVRIGCDPTQPALAPITAVKKLMSHTNHRPCDIHRFELMEAFAVQAIVCLHELQWDHGNKLAHVNVKGGALARGHPIGASGAILAVRLWHDLQELGGGYGVAAIPAAGGLGSALMLAT